MVQVERSTWPFSAATCRRVGRTTVVHHSVRASGVRLSGESPDRTGRWPVPPGTELHGFGLTGTIRLKPRAGFAPVDSHESTMPSDIFTIIDNPNRTPMLPSYRLHLTFRKLNLCDFDVCLTFKTPSSLDELPCPRVKSSPLPADLFSTPCLPFPDAPPSPTGGASLGRVLTDTNSQ